MLVEGEAEHGLGVDGEVVAVAVEEVAHLLVAARRRRRGPWTTKASRLSACGLPRVLLRRRFLSRRTCVVPGSALSQSTPRSSTPGTMATSFCSGDLEAVDDVGGGVGGRSARRSRRTSPSRRRESCMSVRRLTPSLTMSRTSSSSKTGLRSQRFHCFGALGVVADFLGVEVGPLVPDVGEVEAHVDAGSSG